MEGNIPLSEMIQTLREELEVAQAQAATSTLKLNLDSAEIELSVAVTKSKSGSGKVKFWVIEAGGELGKSDVATHKFKLVLKPAQGNSIQVAKIETGEIARD